MTSLKRGLAATALLLSVGLAGCYNTYQVPPPELPKLHGFRAGQKVTLQSVDNDAVPVDAGSELTLESVIAPPITERYSAIRFDGSLFVGAVRGRDLSVNLDLANITNVQVRNYSKGKAFAFGFGLGVPLTLIVGGLALTLSGYSGSSSSKTSTGSHHDWD